MATYPFETPLAFMADFAVTATFGSYSGPVILSMPGEDILGGRVASNQYEMEYLTTQFPGLTYGSAVTADGISFSVLQTYMLDDGTFSRARLQTVPAVEYISTEGGDAITTEGGTPLAP